MTDLVARLVRTLEGLVEVHEDLLSLAARHRNALSQSDGLSVEQIAAERSPAVERLAALERERVRVMRSIKAAAPDGASTPNGAITLAAVAGWAGEPDASRLRELGASLRTMATSLRAEQRVIRAATVTLVNHLDGVMRRVMRAVHNSPTYTQQGGFGSKHSAPARLDLRR